VRSQHRHQHGRDKPYLVDNRLLSERFRDKFLAGLAKLHCQGQLKLYAKWYGLRDPAAFAAWLKTFQDQAWVVFIEPPPTEKANPADVVKYLARYLTGGPISDRRLLDDQDGQVTFWARGRDKHTGHQREAYTLPGAEFVRRWALHILPKGFVKSRCFGGFSCKRRKAYLAQCRTLLGEPAAEPPSAQGPAPEPTEASQPTRRCPRCQIAMECLSQVERPGWNRVLNGPDRPAWYDPFGDLLTWGCRAWYRETSDG
jgi:hypothetical protein